jgi:hypothetical protein
MPNAQTHLDAVSTLLSRPPIQAAFPALAGKGAQAAFLLGAIAPDVRAIGGQAREATHFFSIPRQPGSDAVGELLSAWPELANVGALSPEQAAFVAGYVTHLVMDEVWVELIVMHGLFVEGQPWGVDHPNWWLYSLLMTYLEYRAAARLPADTPDLLRSAEPQGWLPFAADSDLIAWRDHVAARIGRGGARLISEGFAYTNGLTPEALEAIVLSEEQMDSEVFTIIPRSQIDAFDVTVSRRNEAVVRRYLAGDTP